MKMFAIALFSVVLPLNSSAQWREDHLKAQVACEERFIHDAHADELLGGEGLEVLTKVAKAFDLKQTPHLYVFSGSGGPVYIAASRFTDGKGKIFISNELLRITGKTARGNTAVLEGMMGHELAHLVTDDGAKGCEDRILSTPEMERGADALAAKKIGYQPVQAFLLFLRDIPGPQSWVADARIKALEGAR